MAKIKHTKNELKSQREGLRRFERFLPMLVLKKQQLQAEVLAIELRISEKEMEDVQVREGLRRWAMLLDEPVDIDEIVTLEEVLVDEGNIAGVAIPVFRDIRLRRGSPDLFTTPPWFDDAIEVLGELLRIKAERSILAEQRRLISQELRVTNQRVNLFEKVKIPECRENIRVIRIFLGDEQTASVARAKIAKSRGGGESDAADVTGVAEPTP